ncbi:MAG: exodeoxyribonuclease III [Chloroflexia bacterium]|nr:exodeoxyribonuclease III [Chloroflexia bacterium]
MAHFKLATFNSNSIRARLEQVLDWLQREQVDVLCLQETKVQDPDFPQAAFREAGYHVVFRGQKSYAGVAIVSRAEPEEVAYGLDDGGEADEARLVRALIQGISVVNTYVPQGRAVDSPHFQYKLQWLARLRDLFERHYRPDQPLIWAGDLNVAPEEIDVHDPKRLKNHVDFHPEARQALEQVREWGFVDVFRRHHPDEPGHYTYWDYRVRNSLDRGLGWRIDHIWATPPLAAQSVRSWIDREARRGERPSDHTFLVAEFAL